MNGIKKQNKIHAIAKKQTSHKRRVKFRKKPVWQKITNFASQKQPFEPEKDYKMGDSIAGCLPRNWYWVVFFSGKTPFSPGKG
jgi:hypothetical protein